MSEDIINIPKIIISDFRIAKEDGEFCIKEGNKILLRMRDLEMFHGFPRYILKGDTRGFSSTEEYNIFRKVRERLRKDWCTKNNYNYVSSVIEYARDERSIVSRRKRLRDDIRMHKILKSESVNVLKQQLAEMDPDPEIHVKGRKAYHGMNRSALIFINTCLKFLVEQIDPRVLTLVRRFPLQARRSIYRFATEDPRYLQFTESFPVFAAFLSLSIPIRYGNCSVRLRNDVKEAIRSGQKLKDVCAIADFPIEFRKIRPQGVIIFLNNKENFEHLQKRHPNTFRHLIPKKTMQQYRWLSLMSDCSYRIIEPNHKSDWFHWVASSLLKKHNDKFLLNLRIDNLKRDYQLFNDAFAAEPWNTKVDFDGAMRRQEDWHRREQERQRRIREEREAARRALEERNAAERTIRQAKIEAELKKPFPEPFLPGYAKDEWEIVPLLCRDELEKEGDAMHHCVGSYASTVVRGDSYIYSLRRDNERLATLELTNKYKINQLRGHCNKHPGDEAFDFVNLWIREKLREKKKTEIVYKPIMPIAV